MRRLILPYRSEVGQQTSWVTFGNRSTVEDPSSLDLIPAGLPHLRLGTSRKANFYLQEFAFQQKPIGSYSGTTFLLEESAELATLPAMFEKSLLLTRIIRCASG